MENSPIYFEISLYDHTIHKTTRQQISPVQVFSPLSLVMARVCLRYNRGNALCNSSQSHLQMASPLSTNNLSIDRLENVDW